MKVYVVRGDDWEDNGVRAVYRYITPAMEHVEAEKNKMYPDRLTWDEYEVKDEFEKEDQEKSPAVSTT